MMFRQIFVLLLTFIYFLNVSGVVVRLHICKGRIASVWGINVDKEGCACPKGLNHLNKIKPKSPTKVSSCCEVKKTSCHQTPEISSEHQDKRTTCCTNQILVIDNDISHDYASIFCIDISEDFLELVHLALSYLIFSEYLSENHTLETLSQYFIWQRIHPPDKPPLSILYCCFRI